jgi:hypothetical protein
MSKNPNKNTNWKRRLLKEQLERRDLFAANTLGISDYGNGLFHTDDSHTIAAEFALGDSQSEFDFDAMIVDLNRQAMRSNGASGTNFELGANKSQGVSPPGGGNPGLGVVAEVLSDGVYAIFKSSLGSGQNPFGDLTHPQRLTSTSAGEILYGGSKDDVLRLVHPNSGALGGGGNDRFHLDAENAYAYGIRGKNAFNMNASFVRANGGRHDDTYKLRANVSEGVIADSSPMGTIDLSDLEMSDVRLRQYGSHLRIETSDNRSVTFQGFSTASREGWKLTTKDGTFALQEAVRLNIQDAASAALSAYPARQGSEISGLVRETDIRGPLTGLRAVVYDRVSFPGNDIIKQGGSLPSGHKVVAVAGTQATDPRDYASDLFLGQPQVMALTLHVGEMIGKGGVTHVTLTGESLGGIVSVKSSIKLALENPTVQFDVVALNTLGVKESLISKMGDLPPNLSINYVEYEYDFLHKLNKNLHLHYLPSARVITIPGNPADKEQGLIYNHSSDRIVEYWSEGYFKERPPIIRLPYTHGKAQASESFVTEEIPQGVTESLRRFAGDLASIELLPEIPKFESRIDFGSNDLVAPGWTTVDENAFYNSATGIGWKAGAKIEIKDRIVNDDMRRDVAVGKLLPFQINLDKGFYDITVIAGDEHFRQEMAVTINGVYLGNLASLPGESRETTYRVPHGGGVLDFELRSLGGKTTNAVMNGLVIRRAAAWTPIASSSAKPTDPSVLFITPDYSDPVPWLQRVKTIGDAVYKIGSTIATLATGPIGMVSALRSVHTLATSTRQMINAVQSKTPAMEPWVFQAQIEMNLENARRGLPLLRTSARAVPLTTVETASNEQLTKLFRGDVVIIDARKQLNDGIKPFGWFGDGLSNESKHRKSMERLEDQLFRIARIKTRELREGSPSGKVDLHFIGHGLAATASRHVVDRLANAPIAASIDHVGLEMLAPIAAKDVSKYYLYHPETRPFSLTVRNFYERKSDVPGDLIKGKPLDDNEDGGYRKQLDGISRIFSEKYPLGELMLQNLTRQGKFVSGNVIAEALSADGRMAIMATDTGFVSVFDVENRIRKLDQKVIQSGKLVDLKFSKNGESFAVLSSQGDILLYDTASLKQIASAKVNRAVTMEWASGDTLVVGRSNGELLLVGKGGVLNQSLGDTQDGLQRIWLNGNQIVTQHNSRNVLAWELDSFRLNQISAFSSSTFITALDVDLASGAVVMAQSATVNVLQLTNTGFSHRLSLRDFASPVRSLAISSDGSTFATGGGDEVIRTYAVHEALNGRRVPGQVFKSTMLEVRRLSLTSDGKSILAGFAPGNGGSVHDRDITNEVKNKIGLFDIFEEAKAHRVVPYVWLDLFVKTSPFFTQKDSHVHNAVFGASNPGWQLALPKSALQRVEDLLDFLVDPPTEIEQTLGVEFVPGQDRTLTAATQISLAELIDNPNQLPLAWSVTSSRRGVIGADISGTQLSLTPVGEGSSSIELTASYGGRTVRTTFTVSADGGWQREKLAELDNRIESVVTAQRDSLRVIDDANSELTRINGQRRDLEDAAARLLQNWQATQAEVRAAENRLQELDNELANAQRAHSIANSDRDARQRQVNDALGNFNRLDSQTKSLRQNYLDLDAQTKAAWQRFQNASKNQQAQRRAEWERLRDRRNAVEASWRSSQSHRDASQRILSAAQNQLNHAQTVLRNANTTLTSVTQRRSNVAANLVHERDREVRQSARVDQIRQDLQALLKRHSEVHAIVATNARTIQQTKIALAEIAKEFQTLNQTKWLSGMGLQKFENDKLKPTIRRQDNLGANQADLTARVTRVAENLHKFHGRLV